MECEINQTDETLFARLDGEIDHHSAKSVREKIDFEIENSNVKTLVLDFSDVTFMDSSGIGLIMGRYKLMKTNGGEVTIKNPSPNTLRVLKLAGMDRLAKIERNKHDESC